MRFNMPFGRVGAREFGTYFIGYARTPDVIEEMLGNMFIGKPPCNYDRILDFSTAMTGNLFFVPTADFLEDPSAKRPPRPAPEQVPSPPGNSPISAHRLGAEVLRHSNERPPGTERFKRRDSRHLNL